MSLSAFVLHSRPYKESSALLDVLSPLGRVRAVLRGARRHSGSLARPFVPLALELKGKTELKSVVHLEADGIPHWLTGQALYSGFYLNELLMRVLPAEDPCPALFEHYALTLSALANGQALEPLLRAFEWRLLAELGYGFALDADVQGQPVQARRQYRFCPANGFEAVSDQRAGLFSGTALLALHDARWDIPGTLPTAKRLMRQALAPHLGERPLVSRTLFLSHFKESPHVAP